MLIVIQTLRRVSGVHDRQIDVNPNIEILQAVPIVTPLQLIILIQSSFPQTEVLRLDLRADEPCGNRPD
jgi:hypothetical protein